MHFLQLPLAVTEKFSSVLQILGLEELLVVQHARVYWPLSNATVLVGKEFLKIHFKINNS